MSKLDDAKSIANVYLDEIDATVEIRQSYNSIVVLHAGVLMDALSHDERAQGVIQRAQNHKAVDPSTLYKSLLVQINGVFENYIRNLVEAVVENRVKTKELYSDLEQKFRNNYIAHAAHVLTNIKGGSVMGVAYNFDDLLINLGKGLSDQKGYKLNAEVYTKLMGNCTPARLEQLFEAITLPQPFSDKLGNNPQLKAHFEEKNKGRVARGAKRELEHQIDVRNDIVHGNLTRSVDLTQLRETLAYFRALISGLDDLVRP